MKDLNGQARVGRTGSRAAHGAGGGTTPAVLSIATSPRRERVDGRVALIGAGPGDPELLTLKAARYLQQADCVLYDRLVNPAILELLHPRAERLYTGKRCGDHHVPQHTTEALMVARAQAGRFVARLKGGDPFLFGRGGEELQALTAARVPVEVVPGITAGLGCGAYAGIPLTHRDCAHSCVFLTGHSAEADWAPDWAALARPGQTLVLYMGLRGLARVSRALRRHGLPGHWPVALIERGTLPNQRVVEGTLADIEQRAEGLQSPTLAIIGEVVRLRQGMAEQAALSA